MGGGIFNRESSEIGTRTAHRSCLMSKVFSFSQQIEKFSWHLRRNIYVSPLNYCEETDCNWTLVIQGIREPERFHNNSYCDYIEMSLSRSDYKKEYQSIDVRLTVMDSFEISPLCASKEINFTLSSNEEIVLRVKKSELFHDHCGLNKVRFLPNDTLTVKCEITAYETIEESYASEDELEDTRKYLKKEFFEWMLFTVVGTLVGILVGILVAFGSPLYIYFYFVLPKFSWLYQELQIIVFFVYITGICMLIALVWFFIPSVWSFIKPGGDRTYHKAQIIPYRRPIPM